jgi:hypothetical protein
MAIIVEEEEKSRGGMGLLIGAVIVILIGLGVYYIFFKRPELVEYATPANFKGIEQLSTLKNLSPDEVINSASFRALQPHAEPLAPNAEGRQNPLLGTF